MKSKKVLQDLFLKYSTEFDFYVAPIGPKPALVGLYLAYEEKPMFRVVYPHTIAYNVEHYSTGCREIYEMILDRVQ